MERYFRSRQIQRHAEPLFFSAIVAPNSVWVNSQQAPFLLLHHRAAEPTVAEATLRRPRGHWCKRQDLARYDVGRAAGGVGIGKLMGIEQLFEGRHFDREVIILCACAGIFASS